MGIWEVGSSYGDVDYLIDRCRKRMKLQPKCVHCGSVMMFRGSVIVRSPIRDDLVYKCPNCFSLCLFGVPMTEEEFEEEFELRKGTMLMNPTRRFDEKGRDDVLKRLRALGYLG